jgi:hypothetical protein
VAANQTITITAKPMSGSATNGTAQVTVIPAAKSAKLVIATTSLSNGTTGTAYSARISATGGTTPYTWSISSGTLPTGWSLDTNSGTVSGTTSQSGSFRFTVQVLDAAGNSATQALAVTVNDTSSGSYDGPAELPRVYLQTSMADTPAPGKTIVVNAGGDLQSALDSAACGDTVTLQAGAAFYGNYNFAAKGCDDQHWVIVRTSSPDSSLPPEGTRLTPCYAGVSSLPGRPALKCKGTSVVTAQILYSGTNGSGPITLLSGANYYRFIGLEITRPAGTGYVDRLAFVKSGTADHIYLDRLWMHGAVQDDTQQAFNLAGLTNAALIDSYVSDMHCESLTGACTDSHAVGGGTGDLPGGPYKIYDNFLEASGENILFGGAEGTTTPADITVQHNHFFKPLTWMKGQPGYVTGPNGNPFAVKNHFELKNAQRVLFEGNILEYTWGGFSQFGYSILLTPKNQHSGSTNVCPLCQVTDVTVRYSTISHAGAGISMATAISGNGSNGGQALAGERFSVHDITIDDINESFYTGSGTLFQILNSWTNNVLNSITVDHVTAFPDPSTGSLISEGNDTSLPTMWGLTVTNTIAGAGRYPVWNTGGGSTSCGYSDVPITSLTTCYTTYKFYDNVMVASPTAFPPDTWPAGNFFPQNVDAVQFVNYNNGIGGDYHLKASSPYKNAGTDGLDLGANIDLINSFISGVY